MHIRDRFAAAVTAVIYVVALLASLVPSASGHMIYKMSAYRVPAISAPVVYRHSAPIRPMAVLYYTVQPGDSLSAIASKVYHGHASAWPVLYYANKGKIRWANIIYPAQHLLVPPLPGTIPTVPNDELSPAAPADPPAAPSGGASSGGSAVISSGTSTSAPPTGGYAVNSSFQACVIARESGGNAQVMNSSGHYGLYQFSESTWVAYGGSAAEFGHASAAYQTEIFNNAMAAGGESNWSPYDGC